MNDNGGNRREKIQHLKTSNFKFQINHIFFIDDDELFIRARGRARAIKSKLLADCVADSFKKLSNLFTVNLFMSLLYL